jgi:hypothetical protein
METYIFRLLTPDLIGNLPVENVATVWIPLQACSAALYGVLRRHIEVYT